MITIKEALPNELNMIQDIAYKTWPVTYGNILSNTHLTYMLEMFYSLDGLNKNLEDGHLFLLAEEDGNAVGFASYVHHYPKNTVTKIPKIYVLPENQGKGIGKMLIEEIETRAMKNGDHIITLNVNRNNPARFFYEKIGFEIAAEENVDIGNGVIQEDYIMEKRLP
jgi:ribosomal protein S18 acetylase RimI-like enzyme